MYFPTFLLFSVNCFKSLFTGTVIGINLKISLNVTFKDEYKSTTTKTFTNTKEKISRHASISKIVFVNIFFCSNENQSAWLSIKENHFFLLFYMILCLLSFLLLFQLRSLLLHYTVINDTDSILVAIFIKKSFQKNKMFVWNQKHCKWLFLITYIMCVLQIIFCGQQFFQSTS